MYITFVDKTFIYFSYMIILYCLCHMKIENWNLPRGIWKRRELCWCWCVFFDRRYTHATGNATPLTETRPHQSGHGREAWEMAWSWCWIYNKMNTFPSGERPVSQCRSEKCLWDFFGCMWQQISIKYKIKTNSSIRNSRGCIQMHLCLTGV